ncbi:MAG: AAA family ATPase [Candidatus Margulisiibacteriota bacterium]|jgi:predicted AAA+ superfamily ATPase
MKNLNRIIEEKINATLKRDKSILLLGPRQTGKTTLAKKFKADLYLTLIDPNLRQRYEQNPGLLISQVKALSSKKKKKLPLIVLDEVQAVPKIMDAVQILIDEQIATFFLTGSSARKLKNLLPGRIIKYQLDPLTITELIKINLDLESYLLNGTLPGIYTLNKQPIIEEELQSYVITYLEEEIRKEALVRNLAAFAHFLELACIESGNLVSFRNISQEIGIAHTTVAEYYNILEDCMVIERFDPITKSQTRKRLTTSPKFTVFDLGIRRIGAKEGIALPREKMAQLFEQWVGLELRRLLRAKSSLAQVKFWRDHSGPEVDWVIEYQNQYLPIEVKWTNAPKLADAKHLIKFMEEYNAPKGWIICRTPEPLYITDKITAIPWQQIRDILFHI